LLLVLAALLLSACGGSSVSSSQAPALSDVVSSQGGQYEWAEVTPAAAFAGRDGAGAIVLNGRAYLLGGWRWAADGGTNFPQTGAPGCCDTAEVWSTADGASWRLETVAPWRPRHMAGWVSYAGKLWVVGGDIYSGSYDPDVWSSPDGVTWTQVTDSVPWSPRVLHYVVAFNDALYVIGGQQLFETLVPVPNPYPTAPVYYRDVWRSTDGANWEQIGNVPHAIGMICGSVVFNDELWVIGGGQYGDNGIPVVGAAYNEVWSSKDGVTWTQHSAAPWPARDYHNVVVFDGKLWVMAGDNLAVSPNYMNDVWYSADGETWQQLPGTPWVERHAATAFVLNNTLYFTGGTDNSQQQHNDVWAISE
jgi:N-acetylneuraminic acid mutarotase